MYLGAAAEFQHRPGQGGGRDGQSGAARGARAAPRSVTKTALDTAASAANLVPQGGLFWDGRADTLQAQALVPLLDPLEMDGGGIDEVAAKLRQAALRRAIVQLFGAAIFGNAADGGGRGAVRGRRATRSRTELSPLHQQVRLLAGRAGPAQPAELRGYLAVQRPGQGQLRRLPSRPPAPDGLPPLFTDHQFEALGVPRNNALAANRDPCYFDLGICGPYRTDMAGETQYCGMFLTPTLRNVATRQVFFHNGVYRTLQQVMDFYNFRDTQPEKIYPAGADGAVAKFDDIPPRYRVNVDIVDPPFDRQPGERRR